MRIQKLTLQGFKSFPEKTEFHFPQGMTCIVGPNGCGKTNIVDAIRFCLGEQSAKKLRGKSVADMVFGGANGKSPLNFCEVSMLFGVEKGELPEPYQELAELEIKRVLYRSGESEYYINRTPSLLKDIFDLFYGTGLSPYSYGMMDQNDVTRIITIHAEERRLLLEEAAGITKFRRKRQEAERKMERARLNLQRVRDVIHEVEHQKRILERQAKKAQKYRDLVEALKSKEMVYFKAEYDRLSADLNRLSGEEEMQGRARQDLEAEIARLDALRQEAELGMAEVEESLRSLRESVQRAAIDTEQWKGRLRQHEANREALEKRLAELGGQAEAARGDLRLADEKLRELDGERRGTEEALNQARLQAAERRPRRDEALTQVQSLKQEEETVGREHLDALARVAEMERVLASAETRRSENEKRSRDLEGQKQRLLFSDQQQVERLAELQAIQSRLEEELAALRQDTERTEEQARNLAHAMDERLAERQAKREELEKERAIRASLQGLQDTYAGFHEGAREILLKWGRNGIKGTVAEFLEVPDRYRQAVEAVLGVWLEAVVTDTRSYGYEALSYLRQEDRGRSLFVPLDMSEAACPTLTDAPGIEGAERLSEKVQAKPGFEPLVSRLLSHAWVVERLEEAFGLPPTSTETFVTRWGEVYQPPGILSGGARPRQEAASLAWIERREKLDELNGRIESLDRELKALDEDLEIMQARRAELETQRASGHAGRLERESRWARVKAEREGVEELVKVSRATEIAEEVAMIGRTMSELVTMTAEAEQTLEAWRGTRKALEVRTEELRGALAAGEGALAEEERALAQVSFTEVQLEERHVQLTRSILEVERLRESGEERLRGMEETVESVSREIAAEGGSIESARGRLAELEAEARAAEGRVAEAEARLTELRDRRAQTDTRIREEREKHRAADEALNEIAFDRKSREMERDRVVQEARERWGVEDLSTLDPAVQIDAPAVLAEIQELRDRRQKLGDVNLGSLEEYEELSQRYTFLTGQHEDILKSMDQLREAISRINRVCREKFDAIFEEVSKKFSEVFTSLIEGGKGELRLVEPPPVPEGEAAEEEEDGAGGRRKRERGVEIFVKMPGKNMTSLNLLSGGERALTAFSFLLSLFLVRPSPFCILDEVDAPLDDSNVRRFAQTLGQLGQRHPFLVITHNKQTMRQASTLIGVTMEQDGVSKLVSVKVN